MKNTKFITLVAGALLLLTQAVRAAQEVVQQPVQPATQVEMSAPVEPAEQAVDQAADDNKSREYIMEIGKEIATLSGELSELQNLMPQKLAENKRQQLSERLAKLKKSTDSLLTRNPLPKDLGPFLSDIFTTEIAKLSAAITRTQDTYKEWEAENAKVEKDFIFGLEDMYAAHKRRIRVPLNTLFSIRLEEKAGSRQEKTNGYTFYHPAATDELELIDYDYIPSGNGDGDGTRIFNIKAVKKGSTYVFIPKVEKKPVQTIDDIFYKPLTEPVTGYFTQFIVE